MRGSSPQLGMLKDWARNPFGKGVSRAWTPTTGTKDELLPGVVAARIRLG